MRLCGVEPSLTAREREAIADALGVDGLLLHEQARGLEGVVGYRHRGTAVQAVLAALDARFPREDAIAEAGFRAGLWAAPARWDQTARVLRRRAYPAGDTRGPPSPE